MRGVVRGHKNPFKSTTYYTAYKAHLGTLADLKARAGTVDGYHKLKQTLYKDCMTNNSDDTETGASAEAPEVIQTNIVTIDLSGDSSSDSDSE